MNKIRVSVLLLMTVVILALVNLQIAEKEKTLKEGTTVLLQLAPRDPRSLLQGDYMALRYAITREVSEAAGDAGITDGRIVFMLDDNDVASFVAIYDGQALKNSEHLLQFRKRGEIVRLGSDAYFFEEGTGDKYSRARYGELAVAADGAAVLVALRNNEMEIM